MAESAGYNPATFSSTGRCTSQLCYDSSNYYPPSGLSVCYAVAGAINRSRASLRILRGKHVTASASAVSTHCDTSLGFVCKILRLLCPIELQTLRFNRLLGDGFRFNGSDRARTCNIPQIVNTRDRSTVELCVIDWPF